MAILEIVNIGAPVLRVPAASIAPEVLAEPETQTFIDDLIETMHAANGAGLAAPQVGRSVRICAIEVNGNPRYPYKPDIPLTVLVNPSLEPLTEDTFDNYEGCLSVPDLRGVVRRVAKVRVRALDRHGAPVEHVVRGFTAGTYQHEIDHLDATLFVDRVEDPTTFTTWAEFDRHHRDAWLERAALLVERFGR